MASLQGFRSDGLDGTKLRHHSSSGLDDRRKLGFSETFSLGHTPNC